jgi:Carboxypeptidase regulatory-like domain
MGIFKTIRQLLLAGVVTAITLPAVLRSQDSTSTITGHVTDPTGAIVVDAEVRLIDEDRGASRPTTTNSDGIYTFALLQPGNYKVSIEKAGFTTKEIELTLNVAQTAAIDVVLTIGNSNQTVTIRGTNQAAIETQTSSLDFLVNSKEVFDLPLNGRNPYSLAGLSPGVAPEGNFGQGLSTTHGSVAVEASTNFETNGGVSNYNEVLFDSVPIVLCCFGQPALVPSVETVDQFQVLTSVPPSQYGRSSGGVLSIATKGGTNNIRGDIYEFFRNNYLDAAPFFTKRAGHPPIPGRNDYRLPHQFNQYGGTIGGPVVLPHIYNGRDKTFFFGAYEGVRNDAGSYATTTVPTVLERQGVFTEAPQPIYDPNNIMPNPTVPGQYIRGLLPGANGYPAGRYIANISPVASAYLNLFPNPTATGTSNNLGYLQTTLNADSQFTIRVDHNLSEAQHSFARVTHDWNSYNQPDLFNHLVGANSAVQDENAWAIVLNHVFAKSPHTLFNVQYGFADQRNTKTPGAISFNPASFGFSNTFIAQQQIPGLPFVTINGGFTSIAPSNLLILWNHYMHYLGGNAVLERGSHTVTIGFDGRLIFEMEKSPSSTYTPTGAFVFSSTFNNGPNPNGSISANQSAFDSLASFLEGYPSSGQVYEQETQAWKAWYEAAYIQDNWRLSPKLTVNLGLRYEVQPGFGERYNRWADFNPASTTPLAQQTGLPIAGGAQFLGTSGNPNRTWNTNWTNFAPRIGFAYNVVPSTVVRGGYGILYLPNLERLNAANSLGTAVTTPYLATVDGFTPSGNIVNPFPNGIQYPQGPAAGVEANAGAAISALVYNTPESYQQQWNFGIQQNFTGRLTFSLNYAGSHGVKLPVNATVNDLRPANFGAVGDQNQVSYLQALVPNPFYGFVPSGALAQKTIQRGELLAAYPQYYSSNYTTVQSSAVTELYRPKGSATYNALQATVVREFNNGLTFSGAYIWSKLLGNVSDLITGFLDTTGNPGFQDYYFQQYEHSALVTDIRNRFTGTALYQLPFGRGKAFAANAPSWLNQMIGGWQVNSIVSVQSGFPLSLSESGQQAFSGTRPSFVPGQNPLTPGSVEQRLSGYLNSQSFRLTQSFELGTVPRSAANMRGPFNFSDDLSLVKDFPIREALRLQFRVEAFNFLNKVEFGLPGQTFGTATFGVISSQANLPRNVQLALKLIW